MHIVREWLRSAGIPRSNISTTGDSLCLNISRHASCNCPKGLRRAIPRPESPKSSNVSKSLVAKSYHFSYHFNSCHMIFIDISLLHIIILTYLPHKAVAEVSKDKEPIGRERAEFNWFESQLMSDSNESRVK